jgi:hypothetical protein
MDNDHKLLSEAYSKIIKEDSLGDTPQEFSDEPGWIGGNAASERIRREIDRLNPHFHTYKLIEKLVAEKRYKEALEIAEKGGLHQIAGLINNLMPQLHGRDSGE